MPKKNPLPPLGRCYSEQKIHFAIGRNSERYSYHTVYIFEPIYHLIGQTNSFEPVMYVKSRLLDV